MPSLKVGVLKKYSRSLHSPAANSFTPYFLKIIYEDNDIIVVNKPAGVNVHSDSHHLFGTLIQEIVKNFPEIKNVVDDQIRPGVVHRLDKETSGVLIIARNQKSFEYLKKQFQERKIKKTYLALIYGKLGKRAGERGVIDLPIARSEKTPILRVARGKTRGELKEALTEYKIVKYFYNLGNPIPDFTLVEVYPKTGRTHQIRAHFKAIGHPVVCDKLYSPKNSCPNDLNRHFLHAYSLEFNLPSGSRIKLEAELPDDLRKVLQKLSQYDKNYYD